MNRRQFFAFLGSSAALGTVFAASSASACGPEPAFTRNLKFAAGSNATQVKMRITLDNTHEFVLAGKPGQKFDIKLDAKQARFSVMPGAVRAKKDDPEWGETMKGGEYVKSFSGVIPPAGRVLIEVSTTSKGEMYTMDVSRAPAMA